MMDKQENIFKIERAQAHEVSNITKLLNLAYKELSDMGLNYTATTQNDDKTKVRISKGRCFVLKDNSEQILGTILMTVENYFTNHNTAYLGQFGVLPEFKKKGLGTMLLNFCENLAAEEGFYGIQLDTAIPAKHLVDWYQRRGYKIVGQEHDENKTYDSYVFEKKLPSRWAKYFLRNKGRDLRPLFQKALLFANDMILDKTALDIGSGIGIETLALLKMGYRVTAIDHEIASQGHIENELTSDERLNFQFILSDFANFSFDQQYHFVWAYLSLPFCKKESFRRVMFESINSVKKGGIFAGSFFGDQDDWSISNHVNGLFKKQLEDYFTNFEILELDEIFEKQNRAGSDEKFWHLVNIIARKK